MDGWIKNKQEKLQFTYEVQCINTKKNNLFFYYIQVWYKCNRWLDIAIINMNAGPVQVYQTCMLVDLSLQI